LHFWPCQLALNFDRSTVKHALQNIQSDFHRWLSHSFRVHQILFRWELTALPRPLAGLGALLLRKREGRKGEGDGPLTQIPGSAAGIRVRNRIRLRPTVK